MSALLPALTTSLLLLAGPAPGQELDMAAIEEVMKAQQGGTASRLVHLMRGDEFFFNMFRNWSRKMLEEGKITAQQRTCLDELKLEEYNQVVAFMLANSYEEPVLEHVITFYSSPIGNRFMRMVYQKYWQETPAIFPLPVEGPKETLAVREMLEIVEFRKSPDTGLFSDPRMITQWDQTREAGATLFGVRKVICKVPKEALPEGLEP